MSYTALYRKFRPAGFRDVKGQDPIVTTLKNQIKSGRIGHAYLFCGTRGTGKTSIAKIFAKAVNCENPADGSPCGECAVCRAISAGASMNVIEIDAASNNGVDNIREIVDEVSYSPAEGKYKVYIIDEVHMLSIGAFNALLKTLEEPPSYVIFILATTEVHKIPVTILSRCQRYDFKRLTVDTIFERIRELTQIEGVAIEDKAVRYIARTADGAMRDALSLLDQCMAFYYEQELTYDKVLDVLGAVDTEVFSRMLREVFAGNVTGAIGILQEMVMQGRELSQFVTDFTWYLRNLLLMKTADGMEDVIDMSTENMARLKEEAAMAESDVIMRYIRVLSELSGQIRFATQKRILIEMGLIRLCRPQMETDIRSLTDRIRQLEKKLEEGILPAKAEQRPQTASQDMQAGEAAVQAAPFERAVPEDIRRVVSKWPVAVAETENPMKTYLKSAYPSLSEDGKLLVIVPDGIAFDYLRQEGHKGELKRILSEYAGKEIDVSVQSLDGNRNSRELFPDLTRLVSENIHMEIEEIEDGEGLEGDEF